MSSIAWIALALCMGVVLGLIFRPFLGKNDSEGGRFLAIVGIITFASGAAWFLQISPLFVNFVLGVMLVNTSPAGAAIHSTLVRTSQPMTLILLIFAGAVWKVPPLVPTLAMLAAFLILRTSGKWLASRFTGAGGLARRDLYRGQLAHGNAAIAMAIGFVLVFEGPLVDAAYTTVLVSILLHNLIAPRLLRRLLADSGEIKRELEA
jgi:Kef-type K+ transport system membrane component KefB